MAVKKQRLVKVWNDGMFDFEQDFKGDLIKIPAGQHIIMDRFEGTEFKSKYYQPRFNKNGRQTEESMKRLRTEEHVRDETKKTPVDDFHCHVCDEDFKSLAGLKAHTRAKHLQSMEDEDARQELVSEG